MTPFLSNLSAAARSIGGIAYYTPKLFIFQVYIFIVLHKKIPEILPFGKIGIGKNWSSHT